MNLEHYFINLIDKITEANIKLENNIIDKNIKKPNPK